MLTYNTVNAVAAKALEIDFTKPFESAGDAFVYGLQFSVFGLVVVFGVLALLWGILEVFRLVFSGTNKEKKSAAKAAPANVEEETAAAIAAAIAAANDDSELVAAITAAIHAYRKASGEVGGFRVVSFKRR